MSTVSSLSRSSAFLSFLSKVWCLHCCHLSVRSRLQERLIRLSCSWGVNCLSWYLLEVLKSSLGSLCLLPLLNILCATSISPEEVCSSLKLFQGVLTGLFSLRVGYRSFRSPRTSCGRVPYFRNFILYCWSSVGCPSALTFLLKVLATTLLGARLLTYCYRECSVSPLVLIPYVTFQRL